MPSLPPSELQKKLGTIRGELPRIGRPNTLSVCMIVKNEEKNIEAAIRSFMPFADEIVVNDTGSTDKTLEILSRLPVKVIHNPWEGDFSKARNQSLAEATCAWVCWMDADDRVPPESIPDFLKLKTAPLDRSFGFQIVNTQAGMALGARFYQTRMWPNHPKLRFERKVHEQIVYSLAQMGLHAKFIETLVHHTGYEDPELKKVKSERNLALLLGDPDYLVDPILGMQIGDAYSILERWEEAIQAYQHAYAIPNCRTIQADAWAEIPNNIGRAYQQLKNWDEAEKWFRIGLEASPDKLEPTYFLAELFLKLGRTKDAEYYLKLAVDKQRTHSSVSNQYDVLKIHTYHQYCKLLGQKGNHQQRLALADRFAREYPMIHEATAHQGKALLALKRYAEAEEKLRLAVQGNPKDPEGWSALYFAMEANGASVDSLAGLKRQSREYVGDTLASDTQTRLSVAMIVKNEEERLGNCLQSLQALDAEIIVVDTGSTDRTKEIARQYGAKVFDFVWCDDFSAARNASLSHCTGAWITWFDADDVLLPEDAAIIKSLAQGPADRAYGFMVKNSTNGGTLGEAFAQIRMFPNDPRAHFQGHVHEQILVNLQKAGIPVEFKTVRVIHTGYLDAETVAAKQKRNLDLMLKENGGNPEKMNPVKLYSIAGAYQDMGELDEAILWYGKAESRARQTGEDPHVRDYAPFKVCQCIANSGKWELALQKTLNLVQLTPYLPELRLLEAELYLALEQKSAALAAFARTLAFEEASTLMPVDFGMIKIKALKAIAEFLREMGEAEGGIALLKMAKKISEGQVVSTQNVVDTLFELEFYGLCTEILKFEFEIRPSAECAYEFGRSLIMEGQNEQAYSLLKNALQQYPSHVELRKLHDLLANSIV